MEVLGGQAMLNKHEVDNLFKNEETSSNEAKTTALQAWAAYQSTTLPRTTLPVINTLIMDKQVLIFIYFQNCRFLIFAWTVVA